MFNEMFGTGHATGALSIVTTLGGATYDAYFQNMATGAGADSV